MERPIVKAIARQSYRLFKMPEVSVTDMKFEASESVPEGMQALYRDDAYLGTIQLGDTIALPLANRILVHPVTYEQLMTLRRSRGR